MVLAKTPHSCSDCHTSLVGFDPSFVSQIGRFEVVKLRLSVRIPFVGLVFVVDKSFVRSRWLLASFTRHLF